MGCRGYRQHTPIFPHEPKADILKALAALDAIEQMKHPSSTKIFESITDSIGQIAKDMGKRYLQYIYKKNSYGRL